MAKFKFSKGGMTAEDIKAEMGLSIPSTQIIVHTGPDGLEIELVDYEPTPQEKNKLDSHLKAQGYKSKH